MKKITKPTKSPAPATKPAASVLPTKSRVKVAPKTPTKVVRANPSVAPEKAQRAAPAAKKTAAKAPAPAPTPGIRPVAAKPLVTVITAEIDIGFGNTLYVRGEGAGLSWDRGLLLDCVSDEVWSIKLGESTRPILFKFLVNDLSWSTGDDYVAAPGETVSLVPVF